MANCQDKKRLKDRKGYLDGRRICKLRTVDIEAGPIPDLKYRVVCGLVGVNNLLLFPPE